jgi:hypothetical protein
VDSNKGIGVGLTVLVEDEGDAVRVGEVLNRAAAGLALEGYTVSMNYTTYDKDNDKDIDPKDFFKD